MHIRRARKQMSQKGMMSDSVTNENVRGLKMMCDSVTKQFGQLEIP